MIHVQLDGTSLSVGQSQRVSIGGYQADASNPPATFVVGTAAVQILDASPVAIVSWSCIFRNISTGGQRIAVGFTNAVTFAGAGHIIEPGDMWCPCFIDQNIFAISNVATGGRLRAFIMGTT